MKLYTKEIGGKSVIKPLREIVVKRGGMCTYNPSEKAVLADGWVPYVAPVKEYTQEELLEQAREELVGRIREYDSSSDVNGCIIRKDGAVMEYWAGKEDRDSLKGAVRDCMSLERETYRLDLRELGVSLHIECGKLLEMLCALEVYAIDCYNRTTDHIYAAKGLSTIEEMEAYDYREGYPQRLEFEL